MSKIIKLQAENIKRLKACEIEPDGNVIVIGGKNEAGKSSLLDSIAYALGGKNAQCEMPLRKGEKSGYTIIETEDLIIKRTYNDTGGGTIRVSGRDGRDYKSPQHVLDSMIGTLAFDPLAFMLLKPKEQAETLRSLFKIDVSDLDASEQEAYEKRKEFNRRIKDLTSQINGLEYYADAPKEEVKTADIVAELEAARAHNKSNFELCKRFSELNRESDALMNQVASIVKQIEELQSLLESKRIEIKQKSEQLAKLGKEVEELEDIPEDPILDKLSSIDDVNRQVRSNAERAEKQGDLQALEVDSKELTASLKQIAEAKAVRLEQANLPVPGLSLSDGCVMLNGIPLDQGSQSEQLKISVAMGLAQGSDLKVMLVRDGALLDKDNMKLLHDLADQHNTQIWIEVVGERDDCTVVIEDGMVK